MHTKIFKTWIATFEASFLKHQRREGENIKNFLQIESKFDFNQLLLVVTSLPEFKEHSTFTSVLISDLWIEKWGYSDSNQIEHNERIISLEFETIHNIQYLR